MAGMLACCSSRRQEGEEEPVLLAKRPVPRKEARAPRTEVDADPVYSVPPGAQQTVREVVGYFPRWLSATTLLHKGFRWDALTVLCYFALDADEYGNLTFRRWPAEDVVREAHNHGVKVLVTTKLFHTSALVELLSDPLRRKKLIDNLLNAIRCGNADGVDIDFEQVPNSLRHALVVFMSELSETMRAVIPGCLVTQAVPAADYTRGFNYGKLAEHVDYLYVMAYDQHTSTSQTAGPIAAYSWVEQKVAQILQVVPPKKLVLGVPYYGYEWQVENHEVAPTTLGPAQSIKVVHIRKKKVPAYGRTWDKKARSPMYRYSTSDGCHFQGWFEDEESLHNKYLLALRKDLRGVGIWALTYDGGHLWDTLFQSYLLPAGSKSYVTVRRGDTLRTVAQRLGESPEAVMDFNCLSAEEAENIQAGDRLLIPPSHTYDSSCENDVVVANPRATLTNECCLTVASLNISLGATLQGTAIDLEGTAKVINQTEFDIIGLQEVDVLTKRVDHDTPAVLEDLTSSESRFLNTSSLNGGQHGVAILARLPIKGTARLLFQTRGVMSDPMGAFGVRVSLPLAKPTELWVITTQLAMEAEERRGQAEELVGWIRGLAPEGNAIVAGDLGDDIDSPALKALIAGGFVDTWGEKGEGRGLTFHAEAPFKRRDYILRPETCDTMSFTTESATVLKHHIGSHLPVFCTFRVSAATSEP